MKKSFLNGAVALLVFLLIGCTDGPAKVIVGGWQMEEDEGKIVEFLDDGSLATKNGEQTGSGRWSMPGDGKLHLEISTSGGSKNFTCGVQFVDNLMILTSDQGEAERYVRLK